MAAHHPEPNAHGRVHRSIELDMAYDTLLPEETTTDELSSEIERAGLLHDPRFLTAAGLLGLASAIAAQRLLKKTRGGKDVSTD